MEHVVETHDVCRSYGRLQAVSHLDLALEKGEIFGLLGPNGAGKTTSVRIIGATLRPTSGRAVVLGKDTVREPDAIKREIGYVAQRWSLYGDLTVTENLRFFAALYRIHGREARSAIDRAVDVCGLAELRDRLADTMSGGQKQLLSLAVAIVHEPRLLILDEPTAGLDPIHRQQIWDLLYELGGAGHTILVTTHGMDEAERCQRLGFINRGTLLAVGTPVDLKARLEGRLYLTPAPDLPSASFRMRALAAVAWAHPHQGVLRICLRRPGPPEREVIDCLREAAPGSSLEPTNPGLEDVFYELSQTTSRSAA